MRILLRSTSDKCKSLGENTWFTEEKKHLSSLDNVPAHKSVLTILAKIIEIKL